MRRRNTSKKKAARRAVIQTRTNNSSKMSMFAKALKLIKEYQESGRSFNKNAIYESYGMYSGNPIYTPKHTKLKGYQKQNKSNSFNKRR